MRDAASELPHDLEGLKSLVVDLQQTNHHQQREITRLREQLNLLLAKRYGPSREALADLQLRLFNEAEAQESRAEPAPPPEAVTVAAHRRQKRGRKLLPPTLPRVERVYDLPEAERHCPQDGTALEPIGEEVSEQLDVIPATVQVLRHIRLKYACPCCRTHVVTASMPAQPIPKSLASPGTLAHVAVSKYQDALPLYRQEQIFKRLGLELPRVTLAGWMIRAGALIQPLINLLRDRLLEGDVIHCDETKVQVLKEPGKAATSLSYMWVQVSGRDEKPVVLFDYDPSRGGAIPKRLLGDFSGFLHTDGYEGYGAVCRANDITQIGCWAHVRRKYDEALKAAGINPRKPPSGTPPPKMRRTLKALGYIQRLFAIEHRIRDQAPEARWRVRQGESAPVVDEFRDWLDTVLPSVVPGSALGKAIAYTDGQWPKLIRFLEDGRLELHNNRAENAIRPFVVGRKNWLFSDSVAGAKASANLYSLIETAKANGREPYAYLRRVFTELPTATCLADIETLLPFEDETTLNTEPNQNSTPVVG